AHDLVLVLAELAAEGQGHEGVEGAEGARSGGSGLVARERARPARGGGRTEAVAGIVVGEHEGFPALESRAVVGGGRVAGVMVEADDALFGNAEVIGHEGDALRLTDPELSSRGIDEPELGAPFPHLLLEGAAGRRPGDAVVRLDGALVME